MPTLKGWKLRNDWGNNFLIFLGKLGNLNPGGRLTVITSETACRYSNTGFEIRRFRKKLKVKKTQARGKKLKLKPIFEKTQVIFWKTQWWRHIFIVTVTSSCQFFSKKLSQMWKKLNFRQKCLLVHAQQRPNFEAWPNPIKVRDYEMFFLVMIARGDCP